MGIALLEDWFRIEDALLAEPSGLSLADLHARTGIPKASLTRQLATASEWRRVARDDFDRWHIAAHANLTHIHSYAHREIVHAHS